MNDILKAVLGEAREIASKAIQEGRTVEGLRRRAGRYERRAIRFRSERLRKRAARIAVQLHAQADRMAGD